MSKKELQIAGLIYSYIKGEILPEEFAVLKQWMDASEHNRMLFEKLIQSETFRNKLQVYKRFEQYYDFDKISRAIKPRRRMRVRRILGIAASLFLPLAVGIAVWLHHTEDQGLLPAVDMLSPGKPTAVLVLSDGQVRNLETEDFNLTDGWKRIVNKQNQLIYDTDKDTVGNESEIYNEIRVPRGGEYKVKLSDGTQVWLNAQSSIRFPVRFTKNERQVWVSGELFLDVTKDSLRPLIVHSVRATVRVLGTQFNIRDYSDEKQVATTLVNGCVEFGYKGGKKVILNPSQQVVYHPDNNTFEIQEVDTELFTSWKDGVYMFKSQRLTDIMDMIAKWYDVTVFYQDPALKEMILSGRLKRYDHAEMMLHMFEKLGGVKFTVNGKTVIVEGI